MNIYLYINKLDGNKVGAMIPQEDPTFPGIPIEERYAAEFLAECVVRSEEQVAAEGIDCGMIYDADTDTFSWPELPPEPIPDPNNYIVTSEEAAEAYQGGVNDVE